MGRFSRFFGISTLILAMSQAGLSQQTQPVPTFGPAVVGSQTPLPAHLPLATPPAIALPGSGTPIGAPVQVGLNDAKNATGYVEQQGVVTPDNYVVSPQMVFIPGSGNNVASNASPATPSNRAAINQSPVNRRSVRQTGITSLTADSSKTAVRSNAVTLADIASQFKSKGDGHSRQFTNQDIYAAKTRMSGFGGVDANAESMPQSDVIGGKINDSEAISNGVLDQRDLDAVNAALTRSRAKQAEKEQPDSETQTANPKL